MMLYKDTLDFGFDKEDMEYVVGETKQIENYNTKAILQKIREFDNDELVAAKVYERVDGLKPGDHVDEFFLNAYLLRILDILIYIDNEREILEEDETYEVEDDEEINPDEIEGDFPYVVDNKHPRKQVVMQNLQTRVLAYCRGDDNAINDCISRLECAGYTQLRNVPTMPAKYDKLRKGSYPTRRWREGETVPRW